MKKITFLLVLVVMVLGLSGCTRSRAFSLFSVENNSLHKMSASYALLSGTKEKDLQVDDKALDINIDVVTEKGDIDIYIIDELGYYSYQGTSLQSSSFTVTLSDPGKYTIKIEAKKHKGSYKIEW